MRKVFFITILALIASLTFFSFSKKKDPGKFYYAYNRKVGLTEETNRIVVSFDKITPAIEAKVKQQFAASSKVQQLDHSFIIETTADKKQSVIKSFRNDPAVRLVSPVYKAEGNIECGFTDEILVKFKEGTSAKLVQSMLEKYELTRVSANPSFERLRASRSHADILGIANQLQESGLVIFSHPNFVFEIKFCNYIPNDTYFGKQFYLENTGQVLNDGRTGTAGADIKATGAWEITKGSSNITVAVLDMGVTANHPDLPNTRQVRLNGSNLVGANPNDPSPVDPVDSHGDNHAGIIAATQDNNEGISGIAPNCKIMPVRVGGLYVTWVDAGMLASSIEFARANGADVISLGWSTAGGYPDQYPAIVDAISTAVTTGRSGKGCVVVTIPLNGVGYVCFPSNVEISGVLSVGASDRYDQLASYSPLSGVGPNYWGNFMDIHAPSHRAYPSQIGTEGMDVWTMDLPGNIGLNPYPNDSRFPHPPAAGEILPSTGTNNLAYTGRFGGTSAAGPQVAGVAALILSINPNLTQQQVFNILINSADKVGGYNYNLYNGTNGLPNFPGRSQELGYGRLNACNAVTEAVKTLNVTMTGPGEICTSANYTLTNVPAGANILWQVSPPSGTVTLTQTGNTATLTKVGSGTIVLSAYAGASCSPIATKNIVVGTPPPTQFNIASYLPQDPSCFSNGGIYAFKAEQVTGYPYWFSSLEWGYRNLTTMTTYVDPNQTSLFYTFIPESAGDYEIFVRPVNQCGTSSYESVRSLTVVENCIGMRTAGPTANALTVSPNPAKDRIKVQIPNEFSAHATLQLTSLAGAMVHTQSLNPKSVSIDVDISKLKAGVYILTLRSGDIMKQTKVVKL